jgi:hypothetical protein
MEIDKKIKADIAFLLELQKHKIEKTPNGGWDINLFKSSFFNKIKALHKKGEQESVNSILNYFESKNKELGLPNVFTSNHAIWKLRDFVPFEKELEESKKPGNEFNYMMLSRLKSDCDYFLGYGNRSENNLWAGNVKDHITEMKRIWNFLPENDKPEWLSMEDILDYENKMTDKPMEEKKYELGYGSKGNGTTVWNRLDMDKKTNDYKTIAHISNEGEVKFYDKDLPKSVIDQIKQHSIGLKKTKEEILEPNTSDEFYDVIFAQIEPHDDWYGNLMKERHIKRQIAQLIKSNGNEPSAEEVEEVFNIYKNRFIKQNPSYEADSNEIYYTTAPKSYDGFGTFTIEETNWYTKNDKQFRKVSIPKKNIEWQINRYASGGNIAFYTEKAFNEFKNDLFKNKDVNKEPEFEVGQTVFYEDGGYKWLGAVEDVEEIDGNYFYRVNAFAKKSNLQILNTPAETNIKAEKDIKSDDSKDMDFKLYKLVDEFTDQLKDKSTLITPEQVAIVQPEWDKMQEFLNEGKAEEIDKLKIVKPFFGKGQYEVVKSNLSSYEEVIDDLYSIITTMPKTYETDGIPKLEKIAYLHYFTSSSDWYILEKDMESDQRQAFGFVILNGDMQFAELGYVDIEEVKKYAELDFYFDPKTLLEVTSDQVEEKPIEILQPLSQDNPLSSQLKALTGDGYNWSDYTGENGEEVTSGGVIVHKKTGRRFKVPSKFNYFKGIENDYSNQFNLNKGIEEFLDSKDENYIFSDQEKSFLYLYEGYGGLEKEGATGNVLLWEYYTPQLLIKKMWGLANKYGFNHGKVLEPSVGVGRFLDFSEGSNVTAYEINPYSARICRILHPKANVKLRSFEEHFYNGNTFNPKFENNFDLVIGNPPYGDNTGKRSVAESKRLKVAVRKWEHYFILRGLDTLKSGGLLVYVSTANLFTKGYEPLKEKISERAELVDAYLLPNKTFKRTQINTSLIVLRKK